MTVNNTDGVVDYARKAYLVKNLDRLLQLVLNGENIHKDLPNRLLEIIDDDDNAYSIHSEAALALGFAQMSKSTNTEISDLLIKTIFYIANAVCQACNAGLNLVDPEFIISETDVEILTAMVGLLKKIRPKSKRHLIDFLQTLAEGDSGYILISSQHKNIDVSHRYRITQEIHDYFYDSDFQKRV